MLKNVQQGALYGGIISLILVVYIGTMALLHNGEVESLPLSVDNCECFISNSTVITQDNDDEIP